MRSQYKGSPAHRFWNRVQLLWYKWSHRRAIAETARMLANMENALPHPTLAQRLILRYHYHVPVPLPGDPPEPDFPGR